MWLFGVAAASFCSGAGFTPVWSEEFDTLDNASWTRQASAPGNSDTRDAAALPANAYVEDGHLVLRTDGAWNGTHWRNLTSGAVYTQGKRSWKAGGRPVRVCVSAKLPGGAGRGKGYWPAHWLMPDTSACWPCNGEIDILEMINGDSRVRSTYHWSRKQRSGDDQQHQNWLTGPHVADFSTAWHEYAVEYNGVDRIHFAFDGKVFETIGPWSLSLPGLSRPQFYDVPYYVILNTAVGGPWPGPPDKDTRIPGYHLVDYVRVVQKTEGTLVV